MKKAQEKKDVAEMRKMDEWVTKLDRIRNERIRGTTKVGEISKKLQESRLKWYGHVLTGEDEYVGKRVVGMEVPGERRRGRPNRGWLDSIRNDLSERELSGEEGQDRCHGLSVYAVCVCNKVRLPGTGQSAHVIGGSRFTRPASNSRRTLLN